MFIKSIMNERGEITTSKILITVVLLFIIGYFGIKLIPMYFKHEMVKLEVKSAIDNAEFNKAAKIKSNLHTQIVNLGLELDNEQISVEKEDNSVRIIVWWEVDMIFFGKWKKNFYFDIERFEDF